MELKKLTFCAMLAMGVFAVGCGDDCVSTCEDLKECKDATAEQKKVDCDKTCEDAQKEAEDAGCEDEYDDLVSCGADQDDVCKPDANACSKEAEALLKCAMK